MKHFVTTLLVGLLWMILPTSTNAQSWTLPPKFKHEIDVNEASPFEKYNIVLTEEKFVKMQNFSEFLILIHITAKNKYAYMDGRGNCVILKQYEEYGFFREGFAKVKYRGKWGYINPKMEEAIPFQFDEVGLFKDGIAEVRKNGHSFYIDQTGKCVSNCR